MARTIVAVQQDSIIELELVGATLNAKGWDRPEVRLDTRDLENLLAEETDQGLRIRCKEHLNLWIPEECSLSADHVGGTAVVRNVQGDVSFAHVGGSVTVKDAASLSVGRCGGSLTVKNIDGDMTANSVGGSAAIKSIAGDVVLDKVSGSTTLKNIDGNVIVKEAAGNFNLRDGGPDVDVECRGNAGLHLADLADGNYTIRAGGNVFCHLRGVEDAAISLQSDNGNVHLYSDEGIEFLQTHEHSFTLGEGEARLIINAGGNINLDTRSGAKAYTFEVDFGDDLTDDFEGLADEISEQISGQMETQLEELNTKMEHLRTRLQAASGTAQGRLRGAERRINAAQRQLQRKLERQKARAAAQARKRAEPVSESERLTVLQMVQDKKITVEEAEMLLNALEGRAFVPKAPPPPEPPEAPEPPEPPEAPEPPEPPQ